MDNDTLAQQLADLTGTMHADQQAASLDRFAALLAYYHARLLSHGMPEGLATMLVAGYQQLCLQHALNRRPE